MTEDKTVYKIDPNYRLFSCSVFGGVQADYATLGLSLSPEEFIAEVNKQAVIDNPTNPKLIVPEDVKDYRNATDIDAMTPAEWNAMPPPDRRVWKMYWQSKGLISFRCLKCGYPTASGQVGCIACEPPTPKEQT